MDFQQRHFLSLPNAWAGVSACGSWLFLHTGCVRFAVESAYMVEIKRCKSLIKIRIIKMTEKVKDGKNIFWKSLRGFSGCSEMITVMLLWNTQGKMELYGKKNMELSFLTGFGTLIYCCWEGWYYSIAQTCQRYISQRKILKFFKIVLIYCLDSFQQMYTTAKRCISNNCRYKITPWKCYEGVSIIHWISERNSITVHNDIIYIISDTLNAISERTILLKELQKVLKAQNSSLFLDFKRFDFCRIWSLIRTGIQFGDFYIFYFSF